MTKPYKPFKFNQWSTKVSEEDKNKMILYPIAGKTYSCKEEALVDWEQYGIFYFPSKGHFSKSDLDTMRITHPGLKGQEIFIKYKPGKSCVADIL